MGFSDDEIRETYLKKRIESYHTTFASFINFEVCIPVPQKGKDSSLCVFS